MRIQLREGHLLPESADTGDSELAIWLSAHSGQVFTVRKDTLVRFRADICPRFPKYRAPME
jgi:hypothetical protein